MSDFLPTSGCAGAVWVLRTDDMTGRCYRWLHTASAPKMQLHSENRTKAEQFHRENSSWSMFWTVLPHHLHLPFMTEVKWFHRNSGWPRLCVHITSSLSHIRSPKVAFALVLLALSWKYFLMFFFHVCSHNIELFGTNRGSSGREHRWKGDCNLERASRSRARCRRQ